MICTSGRFCLPGLFLVPWLALGSGLGVHRALAAAQPGGPAREEPPAAAQVVGRARGPAEAAGRVDRLGDPLPPGALLRLGTVRFQHGKGIEAAALAPDGKLLVTAGTDAVRVWDTATGRAVAEHEGLP